MKFEDFKRDMFEPVFLKDSARHKFNIENITTDVGMSATEYAMTMKKVISDSQKEMFQHWVKLLWLGRRFQYKGTRRKKLGGNGFAVDLQYGAFVKRSVGYDPAFYFNEQGRMISTYFDTFYPDFDINNPIEQEYEYPYKYMTLECLAMVYSMPQRMELLEIGEREKMTVPVFYDFIVNWTCSYNEKYGDTYSISFFKGRPRYVTKLNRNIK
jgi:hypothetical protein